VNDPDHDPAGRVALEALSAAFADPHRLVDELLAAEDDEDAPRRVSGAPRTSASRRRPSVPRCT
jgi:hypothetical protein